MLLRNVMTSQTSFVYAQVVNRSKIPAGARGMVANIRATNPKNIS